VELAEGLDPSSGPILVLFAVPQEARPFLRELRKRGDRPQRLKLERRIPGVAAWSFERGQIWISGMGKRNAARTLDRALAAAAPDLVFTCGFAGGLNPGLPTSTVVFEADEPFPYTTRLSAAGAVASRFCCVDRVAVTPTDKAELRRQTGADAVEMESGVIRNACSERGIPAATVRVISDSADESLPLDFGALMTPDDRIDFGKLAFALARSPSKIPKLLRFQRRVSNTANTLSRVLVSVVSRTDRWTASN
jgi:nucleoside phosphorylase